MRWQLHLYKDVIVKNEGPPDPERTIDRLQTISAAVFHLEQVLECFVFFPYSFILDFFLSLEKTHLHEIKMCLFCWLRNLNGNIRY